MDYAQNFSWRVGDAVMETDEIRALLLLSNGGATLMTPALAPVSAVWTVGILVYPTKE